jgi:hypothetical protein
MAIGLSPLDPMLAPMRTMKALSFGIDGDYGTAADLAVLAARTATSHFRIVMATVALCQLDGRTEDAARWARVVREVRPNPSITEYLKVMPYSDADFRNRVRSALHAAGFPD